MGLIPKNDLTNTMWYEVTDDLIGPWSEKTENFSGKLSLC